MTQRELQVSLDYVAKNSRLACLRNNYLKTLSEL